jgi:hypothetical protein
MRVFLSCCVFLGTRESREKGCTRWVWRSRCACFVSKLTVTFFKVETMSFCEG